jgi:hypothetical protein
MPQVCYVVPYNCGYCNADDSLRRFTEDGAGGMRNGEIVFTTKPEDRADWLLVQDFHHNDFDEFYTSIPRERRIQALNESSASITYDLDYLEQFGIIISPYEIKGYAGDVRIGNACLGWFAGMGFGKDNFAAPVFDKLSDVRDYKAADKKKSVSIITSRRVLYKGHKKRLDFFKALAAHPDLNIDFFGRDTKPIADKLEALAPYKYHIAIENSQEPYYWTEKLTDAWVGWCLPIYCGDPTILNQVPDPDGIIVINIGDTDASIEKIRRVLAEDPYSSRLAAIKINRDWAIAASDPYERVSEIIESIDEKVKSIPRTARKQLIVPPCVYLGETETPGRKLNFRESLFKGFSLLLGKKAAYSLYGAYKRKRNKKSREA